MSRQAIRDGRFSAWGRRGFEDLASADLSRRVRAASRPPLALVPASALPHPRHGVWLVGVLADGQHVLVSVAAGKRTDPPAAFGAPLCAHPGGERDGTPSVRVYPLDLPRLRALLAEVAPAYRPA
ncbi:MAG TPA: hypothetical protein VEU07_12090, partial [Candidatus Acidoferrum sp.]|nr:hypothetical protein [Candidatus Acidoferrum sp.]